MRGGRFYPGYGLERIVAYHERQDARFAEAADVLSRADGQADPRRDRAGRRRSRQPGPGGRAGEWTALLLRAATGPSRRSATCTGTPATVPGEAGERQAVSSRASAGAQPDRRAHRAGAGARLSRCSRSGGGRRRARPPRNHRRRRPSRRRRRRRSWRPPLLSFRRAPACCRATSTCRRSRAAVADFAATLEDPSCVDVAVDGVPVGSVRADAPLIPASNQKLLTGAVALEVLGADHRFTTEVRAPPRRSVGSWPATSTSSAAVIRCLTSSTVSGRQRPESGHLTDAARCPRRCARRCRGDRRSRARWSATARATTTSTSRRAGSTTCGGSRPAVRRVARERRPCHRRSEAGDQPGRRRCRPSSRSC